MDTHDGVALVGQQGFLLCCLLSIQEGLQVLRVKLRSLLRKQLAAIQKVQKDGELHWVGGQFADVRHMLVVHKRRLQSVCCLLAQPGDGRPLPQVLDPQTL